MKRLTATTLLLLLCSCNRVPTGTTNVAQSEQPADAAVPFRKPSASELFDLQSKCTAMGEKLLQKNSIGDALTQQQVSHYNPKDNRCYVKLTVSSADLRTPPDKYVQKDYLYDGQTGEMLASFDEEGGKKLGFVFDASMKKLMQNKNQTDMNTDAVSDLIDSFVATDRRP